MLYELYEKTKIAKPSLLRPREAYQIFFGNDNMNTSFILLLGERDLKFTLCQLSDRLVNILLYYTVLKGATTS